MSGQRGYRHWTYTTDDDNYTVTWSVEMPPSNAFANIALGQYYEFDDQAHADAGIVGFRRRKADGGDELVELPGVADRDARLTAADPKMTSVTFALRVSQCWATALWNINFW